MATVATHKNVVHHNGAAGDDEVAGDEIVQVETPQDTNITVQIEVPGTNYRNAFSKPSITGVIDRPMNPKWPESWSLYGVGSSAP